MAVCFVVSLNNPAIKDVFRYFLCVWICFRITIRCTLCNSICSILIDIVICWCSAALSGIILDVYTFSTINDHAPLGIEIKFPCNPETI